ncbi:hypothetical protein [Streptomyces sp. NPDC051561]|uniref:hypothetical protein n=1 Tax=Streptomyces sp. NPDC051561 TaxID=3365658 RepID=UPI0037A44B0F
MSLAVGVAVAASALGTLLTDREWGWGFVIRCIGLAVTYLLLGVVMARSRRRAEARDAQHMREIREARRRG